MALKQLIEALTIKSPDPNMHINDDERSQAKESRRWRRYGAGKNQTSF